jgi:hypothetical protein
LMVAPWCDFCSHVKCLLAVGASPVLCSAFPVENAISPFSVNPERLQRTSYDLKNLRTYQSFLMENFNLESLYFSLSSGYEPGHVPFAQQSGDSGVHLLSLQLQFFASGGSLVTVVTPYTMLSYLYSTQL